MEGIEALQERVNALLRRHTAVVRERDAVLKDLEDLRSEHETLRVQFRQTEEALLARRIGNAMPDEATRLQNRKKLDAVIDEIDKILSSLND